MFRPCASPVPDPAFEDVVGDDVSTPPSFEVGAAVKVPNEPPFRVWVTVAPWEAESEGEEPERVFCGVEELVCSGAGLLVVEATAADPVAVAVDPPVAVLAGPEITPVYVALNAETAARTLDGSGAIVPLLYWLHAEVFSSSLLIYERP